MEVKHGWYSPTMAKMGSYLYKSITAEAVTVTYVTDKLSRKNNHHEDLVYVGLITGFMRHLPAIDLPPVKNDIFKQFLSQDLNRDGWKGELSLDRPISFSWNDWAKKLKY